MDSYDLQINQGETFNLSLSLNDANGNPLDLSNKLISGYLKFKYSETGKLADLNATIISAPSGAITLSMTASVTAMLPITMGVYDVEMLSTGDGSVVKILKGQAFISPEVTF